MAKKSSKGNIKIRLNSTATYDVEVNGVTVKKKTGFFYVTKKNVKNTPEKLVVKKYDPKVRRHVEFKEGKIK